MAIETPNFFAAAGLFDGLNPSILPFGNPIGFADGIQAWNPATTPAAPVGGFTRLGVSDYLIKMTRPIDFAEGIAQVSCLPGKPNPGLCVIVGPGTGVDGDVQVEGNGVNDTLFYLNVWRLRYTTPENVTPSGP